MAASMESGNPFSQLLVENFTDAQRIQYLREHYDEAAQQLDAILSPAAVDIINRTCDIQFVFNYHGGDVDALRSVNAVWNTDMPDAQRPFMTFVEEAKSSELHEPGFFNYSVGTAFDHEFNGITPTVPYGPQAATDFSWTYWRDRGLIERGSVVIPVDLRNYSARYVETMLGTEYNAEYIGASPSTAALQQAPYNDMFQEARAHGLKIMYSNGLREYAAAAQISSVLLKSLGHDEVRLNLTDDQRKKLHALRQERLNRDGTLPINVIYGTAHHALTHLLANRGVEVRRTFPNDPSESAGAEFIGGSIDQFFSAHSFGLRPIDVNKYARNLVIESILRRPIAEAAAYGCVVNTKDIACWARIHAAISYKARSAELNDNVEEFYAQFQQDPGVAVRILQSIGVPIQPI